MEAVIHTLATAYHWTKDYILDAVYPDELYIYLRLILMSRIEHDIATLAITQNPHTENPQELMDTLSAQYKQLLPASAILNVEPDKDAMTKLRNILGGKGDK